MRIHGGTEVVNPFQDRGIRIAAANVRRDLEKTLFPCKEAGGKIILEQGALCREEFLLKEKEGNLLVLAAEELGFIYGLYEISRRFLGVTDFWFWNEQEFWQKEPVQIPRGFYYQSKPFRVAFRGWFVNDEVLLHKWQIEGDAQKPWEMVFEALLRCGGNLVIPGTDANAKRYASFALEQGLYLTHHHAEPLGAEMFSRRYPDKQPSYHRYPELFEGLWKEAVERQSGKKILWNLGFRGQGDCPFWEQDKSCQTRKEQGAFLSRLICRQYELVKHAVPDALCCTNLYGEMMELWQEGVLELPEDVIKVWGDNGYGKMVSRRQDNHNPRIPALPQKSARKEKHGIYYHASFYDLQAASHMTMLPNSMDFVREELLSVLDAGADTLWLINCSNVKPHVYVLDYIAALWRDGDTRVDAHRRQYVARYYGGVNEGIEACIREYASHALAYGKQPDEHAGEQFPNYTTRILASQWMKGSRDAAGELSWAVEAQELREQFAWYRSLCLKAVDSYDAYLQKCRKVREGLKGQAGQLFEHTVLLQAEIYATCYRGGLIFCDAYFAAEQGDYKKAFYDTGRAADAYTAADGCMRRRETGIWQGFYANECLCDMKQTGWVLEMLMGYLRNLGDGPRFYQWQREVLYPEGDRRVCLLTNTENHLPNSELYRFMQRKYEDT